MTYSEHVIANRTSIIISAILANLLMFAIEGAEHFTDYTHLIAVLFGVFVGDIVCWRLDVRRQKNDSL